MHDPLEILEKYWGYGQFRLQQSEIISAVLEGKDTLAILPTGGGKSICFQVAALAKEGICLVISPLIALMNDQVANLEKRNIKAIALTGGKNTDDIITLLDNCEFGNYKFLYVSPERLQTEWILERIKNLPINLIAIDEAHCISQWGHDFRPAYLKIANLKLYFPKIPFLALTATATKKVEEDIILSLKLEKPAFFKQSFQRKNIAFMIIETEDKLFKIGQILIKNPQPSIIYVRNRKSCSDIAGQLTNQGFKATFYHGGLSAKEKDKNMQLWISENVQVIVATNAFGMGIDKANVKTVIHAQLPENIENYYQESGRAGRNNEKAFSILLTNKSDIINAEQQFLSVLVDKNFLTKVYIKLCNYFQIAFGEGMCEQFSLNINQFCFQYQFPVLQAFNALQFLDRQGVISLSQEYFEKIMVQFLISSKEVIRYISINNQDEAIILAILRTYSGIYDNKTAVNITSIAKKSETTEDKVLQLLLKLKDKEIIDYQAKGNDSTVIFNEVREDERTINRISKYLENQNSLKKQQLLSVLNYVSENQTCKNKLILQYFGEIINANCGICSFCIKKSKTDVNLELLFNKILQLLSNQSLNSREIETEINFPTKDVIFALQLMLDKNLITIHHTNKYKIKI